MRDDFTNFAWGESSVSHTIEIVVINTASLFNNDLGDIARCSIFAVLDLSFQGVDDLSVIQPSKLTQNGMRRAQYWQ